MEISTINADKKLKKNYCNEMVEAIPYCNELVVVINEIITTKILLQYMIFIAITYFVAKTYYLRVYCNG